MGGKKLERKNYLAEKKRDVIKIIISVVVTSSIFSYMCWTSSNIYEIFFSLTFHYSPLKAGKILKSFQKRQGGEKLYPSIDLFGHICSWEVKMEYTKVKFEIVNIFSLYRRALHYCIFLLEVFFNAED